MPPPARLFVIMAAEAPTAVVIRRGPSSWSNIVAWRTTDDVFTEGAWFKGRIFAEKCDLSPDGELFVYAAHKGKNLRTSYSDAWTAVSRPPWLHALALWPLGTTYGGGGRFKGNCQLVGRGLHRAHPDHTVGALELVTGSAPYHASTNEVDGAEWTGRDQNNRLVFTKAGCVFSREGGKDVLLADMNGLSPRTEAPPLWAMQPLGPRKPTK